MSRRDTFVVAAVALLGVVGAFWFLALAPKRERLSALDKQVAEARQTLDQARQEKVKFARDEVAFPRLYASLGRLGKAVPPDEDVPSLLVQLSHAATQAHVNFHSVELKLSLAEKAEAESADAAASAAAASAGGAGGQTAPPAGGSAQTTPPAGGSAAPAGQAAAATASASAPAAAPAGGATATDPAATATGASTQFKVVPFEYKFKGDFFELEDLIHNVTRLVERRNQELAITGRLITIEGFAMKRGKVTVLATTYMLPADQGLLAGATAQGPAGTDPAAPQAAAAGATPTTPPTAAVTSP